MKRLILCLGLFAGLLPVSKAQNFPTNSNFRIEMGPGSINPIAGVTTIPWYIQDYIEMLIVPNDVILINPNPHCALGPSKC